MLKEAISEDAKLSIIVSYFTVFAYGELREELSRVRELRFVFDRPTFLRRMQAEKEPREWEIQRRAREIGVAARGSSSRPRTASTRGPSARVRGVGAGARQVQERPEAGGDRDLRKLCH